jgi:hypothetical protein
VFDLARCVVLQRAKECKKLKDTTSTTLRKTKMAAERCKEEIETERRAITQLKKDREDKMMEAERLRAQKQGSSKSTLRSLEVRTKQNTLRAQPKKTTESCLRNIRVSSLLLYVPRLVVKKCIS